ncbi:iron-containing alcohol dehydrogenase [Niveispirillum sp. SYP-B3756]|uniref:iron-containing alcohol dehydrogenase n=1 Tax=Niveispirillum sp. SYP-B3756 TaxID=2662178 RepID=UPI0012909F9D|nr:iron-containing alcohol dehydrogenase [Niveispirillum sp. SYP-B3756]MQP66876.1 iron-containing alcohol dehydrogenase [Niveispirillum sp. SYP-B3756]
MIATILTPAIMELGGGAIARAASVLHRLGVRRPLIVTDPWMRDSGTVERLLAPLRDAGFQPGLFADTVPDPTVTVVEQGATILRGGGYDGMLALGGGSPIDTAKAMGVLAANGGAMRDYKVPNLIPLAGLPLVAIPTTAGTGSEVTRFTVITDAATDEKMLIASPLLVPSAAIIDYELTLSCPPRLTADTGIDALTHAIEAYVSAKANPFSDSMALAAMGRIAPHIRTAVAEPGNRPAREAMMLGATLAGMAFSNASVALVHGMSRPIGAFFHVPHGLSNAMLLPAVTHWSLPGAPTRYADCARAIGAADPADGDDVAGEKLVMALRALNADLKVPSPKTYGIDPTRWNGLLETMAAQALASGSPANNPRVPDVATMVALYRESWG